MAKKKEDAGTAQIDAKNSPQKKRGGGLGLFLILVISAAVTLFIVSSTARNRAVAFWTNFTDALAADSANGKSQSSGRARGGDGATKLQNNLVAKFTELELRDNDYSIQIFPARDSVAISASIPRGRPIELIVWELSSTAAGTPFTLADAVCAMPAQTNCELTFKSSNAKHPTVVLNIRQSGRYFSNIAKMAILVEDFGFEANQTIVEYLSFPEPLTVSLVPAQRLAAWTAQIADEYKKEVVLLLPMEPLPSSIAERYKEATITLHASAENIRNIIAQAAVSIPNFSGISSFHGSRIMEDSRVMGIILSEANRRKVYFVYSDASRKSVVPQLVRETGTPSHPFQISIGAEHTAEQARERLKRGAMTAERNGRVLIKTAPTQAFIQVLKEEVDALRSNGIKLVYVSEIVR